MRRNELVRQARDWAAATAIHQSLLATRNQLKNKLSTMEIAVLPLLVLVAPIRIRTTMWLISPRQIDRSALMSISLRVHIKNLWIRINSKSIANSLR